jgi:hypothetical protein
MPASFRAERKIGPAWIPVSPTKAARPSDVRFAIAVYSRRKLPANRGSTVKMCELTFGLVAVAYGRN